VSAGAAGLRSRAARGRRTTRGRPPARRLTALFAVLVIGLAGILVRLVQLQVQDASSYERLAVVQRTRSIVLPASRGSIFDRNGEELALSLRAKAVFANPSLVTQPGRTAQTVARILGLKEQDVRAQLARPGPFVYLARGVDPTAAARLQTLDLSGIGFQDDTVRQYPAGPLAPQVLGFVGVDGTGLAGMEYQEQKLLAGTPGREVVEADPRGVLIPQGGRVDVPPVPGDDLVLTIDREIQFRAQQALQQAVRANGAIGGTVVVMDPRTGQILAMADYPWFDPNHFANASPEVETNRAVTQAYEPGSVNKVVTAAAALEEGLITVKEKLTVPDSYQLYTKTFHDAHPHPTERMTLGDILAYSSNIGAIEVAKRLGPDRLYSYLERFGLTRATGLGFPGESKGILPAPSAWSGTSMGTIPIGQGIAVTPLQMACVYATIANGGVWVQPSLVKAVVDRQGREHPVGPPPSRRVVSAATAAEITRMLAYAVDVGTGTEAQIPGFWVAGKTGTARKVNAQGTGYTDKYVATFIGFTPAAAPQLLVAAVLDEPATVYAGVAAAPLFQQVAHFALARLRIAPAPKLPIPPHAVRTG
jgi:cell division protein FtsI (penicillin-binding protein 3)